MMKYIWPSRVASPHEHYYGGCDRSVTSLFARAGTASSTRWPCLLRRTRAAGIPGPTQARQRGEPEHRLAAETTVWIRRWTVGGVGAVSLWPPSGVRRTSARNENRDDDAQTNPRTHVSHSFHVTFASLERRSEGTGLSTRMQLRIQTPQLCGAARTSERPAAGLQTHLLPRISDLPAGKCNRAAVECHSAGLFVVVPGRRPGA